MTDIEKRITRLQNLSGSRLVSDGPGGRIFGARAREEEQARVVQEQLYDVVATNGLTHDGPPDFNFLPVEEDLGGYYQRLASYLTAEAVNSTTFHWGRGLAFTNFGIVAVPAGAFCDPELWMSDLEDHNLPADIVRAFAFGTVGAGGCSLQLTLGVV